MSEENETPNDEQENGTPEAGRFLEKAGEKIQVPENFWDSEKNAPDTFAIMKSQMDLRKQIGEDLSPKDGAYEIHIPDDLKDKLTANTEDPLYKEFCKFAKSKRMSQEEFDNITQIYYKTLAENVNDFDSEEYFQKESEALKAKYGSKLDKVRSRIENFVNNSGITDSAILNELKFMQTSAAGVSLLDYLLSFRGEPMPQETTSRAGMPTLQELRNMQAKPEYMTDKDLQEKVRKGYEALYGE